MQILTLVGNLGADAKVVENGGKPFVSFNVANTEKWKASDGTVHESTNWVSCAYNGVHDSLLPFLKAGTKVVVVGHARTRIYSSEKERRMVAGINLNVLNIELVGAQSDEVPRNLYTKDGELVVINKAYWVQKEVSDHYQGMLFSRSNTPFKLEGIWVRPLSEQEAANVESAQKTETQGAEPSLDD